MYNQSLWGNSTNAKGRTLSMLMKFLELPISRSHYQNALQRCMNHTEPMQWRKESFLCLKDTALQTLSFRSLKQPRKVTVVLHPAVQPLKKKEKRGKGKERKCGRIMVPKGPEVVWPGKVGSCWTECWYPKVFQISVKAWLLEQRESTNN